MMDSAAVPHPPARPPADAGVGETPSREIEVLLAIMTALRMPGSGCPWDLAQTFASIAPFTIEEAYEVADAVARDDMDDLRDELGDLLLQVVFHARMAEEAGAFAFGDVIEAITAKLIRRHPHVFGEARDLSPDAVKTLWDEIKRAERVAKPARPDAAPPSVLDGVALGMPALSRADKLTRRAASVGFTWPNHHGVLDKIAEELAEVRAALDISDAAAAAEEVGDLLFTVGNLARHLDVDPEAALQATNGKFERRFRSVERALAARGQMPGTSSLAEMDALWDEAKAAER